ncbi:MAG: TIGR02300 family protein [Methylocystis sp.]
MSKPELGVKRRCLSCAAPFFDLNRTPIVCPKCGALFQIVELAHSRAKWAPSPPIAIKTPVAAVDPFEAETAEPEVEDEDEDAQDDVEIPPIEEDDEVQLTEIIDIDRDAAKPDS